MYGERISINGFHLQNVTKSFRIDSSDVGNAELYCGDRRICGLYRNGIQFGCGAIYTQDKRLLTRLQNTVNKIYRDIPAFPNLWCFNESTESCCVALAKLLLVLEADVRLLEPTYRVSMMAKAVCVMLYGLSVFDDDTEIDYDPEVTRIHMIELYEVPKNRAAYIQNQLRKTEKTGGLFLDEFPLTRILVFPLSRFVGINFDCRLTTAEYIAMYKVSRKVE